MLLFILAAIGGGVGLAIGSNTPTTLIIRTLGLSIEFNKTTAAPVSVKVTIREGKLGELFVVQVLFPDLVFLYFHITPIRGCVFNVFRFNSQFVTENEKCHLSSKYDY